MKAELGLTDEQAIKMKSSREAMSAQLKSLRENSSLTDDARKEQAKELIKKQREEMKSILTEEQFKKWNEQKKHKPHRKKIV